MRFPPLAVIGLLLLAACPPPPTPVPSGAQQPDSGPALLDQDDLVEIKVFLEDILSGEFRVDGEGTITYPLLGRIPASGTSPSDLAARIQAGLADGYLRNPQVAVTVIEWNSRKISVIGEVKKPGRYPWQDGMTLVQAIAEAGGTTPTAALWTVQITRTRGERTQFSVPFRDITLGRAPDFPLAPGDVVFVQESSVK